METIQKIELQANRILGEYIGTVEAILHWDIPDELRVKVQSQLEKLSKVKIISSNGDVSGNEANQPEFAELFKAIDKINEGHYGSAKNFIERYINSANNEKDGEVVLPKLDKEKLLKWLQGLRDSQYSEINSESTEQLKDWYDTLIENIKKFWQ